MAESGTLTVAQIDTTVGTGRVAATLTDVSLREVTVDGPAQEEVEDGCTTRIGSCSTWSRSPSSAPLSRSG